MSGAGAWVVNKIPPKKISFEAFFKFMGGRLLFVNPWKKIFTYIYIYLRYLWTVCSCFVGKGRRWKPWINVISSKLSSQNWNRKPLLMLRNILIKNSRDEGRIRIRSDPLNFGLPDPEPCCNNWNIYNFPFFFKYLNQNQQIHVSMIH